MKRIAQIKEFLVGVRAELRKITWTTWKELVASTAVVLVAVIIIAVFLGIIDRLMDLGLISGKYSIIQLLAGG